MLNLGSTFRILSVLRPKLNDYTKHSTVKRVLKQLRTKFV